MAQESVFRFLALRQPRKKSSPQKKVKITHHDRAGREVAVCLWSSEAV